MRRSLLAAFALFTLALLPLSASAAPATRTQVFRMGMDVGSMSGVCPNRTFADVSNITGAASGVVNDVATVQKGFVGVTASPGGRFPNQLVGTFVFVGGHSKAVLQFTGVTNCNDPQAFTITGLVWTGGMVDEATGQAYAISGSGRDNSYVITVGPGGFAVTFTGTARPTTSATR